MENWLLIYISLSLTDAFLIIRLCIPDVLKLELSQALGKLSLSQNKLWKQTSKQTRFSFTTKSFFKRAASCTGAMCFTKQDIKMTTLSERYHKTDLLWKYQNYI